MGMVLPLTLISRGGAVEAAAGVSVGGVVDGGGAVFVAGAVSTGDAVPAGGFATSPVRVSIVVATTRHVAGAQVRRSPGVSTSTCSVGAKASSFQSPAPQRTPSAS